MLFLIILLILFALWCFLTWPRCNHPKWALLRQSRYAHRGFHDKPSIPENSLAAFRRAVDNGFGAELDVHLTKDGRLAVIHDSDLKRVCGVSGCVEDFTSQELEILHLEGTSEKIPFLEQVLPLFEHKTPLVVEIKPVHGNHAELTAKTVTCLARFSVEYCMESFDPRVLIWLRHNHPEIVRGQLSQNFFRHPSGQNFLVSLMLTALLSNGATRPDFIAYRFEDRRCIGPRWVCHVLGCQEIDWTIRSAQNMRTAESEGHLVIFEKFNPREGSW